MTFDDIKIPKFLRQSLSALGFSEPTSIQEKSFSVAMSGRDVVGIAQTGTGKTLAYLLPVLSMWKFTKSPDPQIIILLPTRELVTQVYETVKKLTEGANIHTVQFFGGVGMQPQAQSIADGGDVVVSTPGRLLDMILNGYMSPRGVKKLVIDEFDEMLQQGFNNQLGRIFDLLPAKRQNLLFSATMSDAISKLVDTYFNGPEMIEAAPPATPLEQISQNLYEVPNFHTKMNLLNKLLSDKEVLPRVLVFVSTLQMADKVFELLDEEVAADADYIHSRRTQSQRFRALRGFANQEFRILIATDLVARGIDIAGVSHVINFDLPTDPQQYIHRIGRTGRAGQMGHSITFSAPLEEEKLQEIENLINGQIPRVELPEDVEISAQITSLDVPVYKMKNQLVETDATPGKAFHERKLENQKVNVRVSHKELMRKKYGKPITKGGQKKKRK